MSAHGPDERLSAFHDGELSAVERAEVERLLTERPHLRAELCAITDLSQRLSDLADDFPETDLRPRVMQRITAARPAVVALTPQVMRRRWMPLLLSVCSLSLLVAAVWPLLPHSNDAHMLAKTDSSPGASVILDGALASPSVASLEMTGAGAIPSDHPIAIVAKSIAPISPDASETGVAATESASVADAEMSQFLSDLIQSRDHNGRELNPGEVISRVIDGNESSLIAEYTVVDVRRGAHDVGIVLQQHGIVPLLSSEKEELSGLDRATNSKSSGTVEVYVVEAESVPLNNALLGCQALQEVVTSNVESLSPYGPLNSIVASEEDASPSHFVPLDPAAAPLAPAEAPTSPPVAMQRKSGQPDAVVRDETQSKDKPAATLEEPLAAPSPASNQFNRAMADVAQKKVNETPPVFGNSILVENGDELVAELHQRQSQLIQSSNRLNSDKQELSPKGQPFSTPTQRSAQSADSLQQKAYNAPSRAGQAFDGLQYNGGYNTNGLNGFRGRQRAILVLRPQSLPTPPGPAPADPQGG